MSHSVISALFKTELLKPQSHVAPEAIEVSAMVSDELGYSITLQEAREVGEADG